MSKPHFHCASHSRDFCLQRVTLGEGAEVEMTGVMVFVGRSHLEIPARYILSCEGVQSVACNKVEMESGTENSPPNWSFVSHSDMFLYFWNIPVSSKNISSNLENQLCSCNQNIFNSSVCGGGGGKKRPAGMADKHQVLDFGTGQAVENTRFILHYLLSSGAAVCFFMLSA